jgi:CubicO group peptidase (beta-lactamase class C family)
MKKVYSYKMCSKLFAVLQILFFTSIMNAQTTILHPSERPKMEFHTSTGKLAREEINGIDTSLGTRILSAMNVLYDSTLFFNQHGVSASIIVPGLGQWSGTVGHDYGSVTMDTNLLCEVGSITKTFVTALIMKLQDAGKLSIKDSIYKWLLRQYPNVDSGITIEMLLNHSSGVYDYVNDDSDQTVLYDQYETEPSKIWAADTILLNYVKAPNFKPGASFRYSNTNFLLLGLIAERAGGSSLRDLIHSNFIDPLKLTKTFYGGMDSITMDFSHNWSAADSKYPSTDLIFIDKTAQLTGSPGDGNICSTPSDLVRWVRALYLGNVVSSGAIKQMEAMHHWSDGSYYGLGTQLAPYYTHIFYGHSGSMVGFKSAAFANPKDSVCVAVYVNWDEDPTVTDVYLNDYLIAILNEIYKSPSSKVMNTSEAPTPVITVSPNPASDKVKFVISEETSASKLALYNDLGMQIHVESIAQSKNEFTIDVSKIHTGVYFYRIQNLAHVWSGKLFIN